MICTIGFFNIESFGYAHFQIFMNYELNNNSFNFVRIEKTAIEVIHFIYNSKIVFIVKRIEKNYFNEQDIIIIYDSKPEWYSRGVF